MKKSYLLLSALLFIICLTLAACTDDSPAPEPAPQEATEVAKTAPPDLKGLPLIDDASLYHASDGTSVVYFYLTVRKGNAADKTDHTFEEVNAYINPQGMVGAEKIKTELLFQVGDERGPLPGEIGFGGIQANATINVRGRTSTSYPQKSYRIDLYDNAGLWRGQKAIAINKHPSDPTRLRNMLFFRLIQDVPDLASLRTQFVHVFIKDETKFPPDQAFMDYGLFTQVELPNGRYLRNHSLSRNGNLYKANMSELYREEDKIRLANDPEYDLQAFSTVFEPKTGQDHTKLIAMLEAVNNPGIPIEEVVARYFDADNLMSYLAFNLLMANPDSDAQNYLLYSPVNSEKWYYLLWDGDGALSYYEDELTKNQWAEASWTKGISNYWSVVLFNRMFRLPLFRQMLAEKIEHLRQIITPARIAQLIQEYRVVVDPFTHRMPDSIHLGMTFEELEPIHQNLPNDTQRAYQYYLDSLDKPMPFYLGDVEKSQSGLLLSWDDAYDFDGDLVRYQVEVASDWSFEREVLVFSQGPGFLALEAEMPPLNAGTYYWRVIATDERGNSQIAFDHVYTDTGEHHGMRRFVITEDGQVINPQ